MNIEFVNPHYLWLLVLLIFSYYALRFFENIKIKRLLLISNPTNHYVSRSNLLFLFPLLIAALLIISAARPFIGSQTIELPGVSRDIFILQDISKSMLAYDIKPDRLEFSKRKLLDIIKISKSKVIKNRIGLILFSGESYLYCPLTEDYGVLEHFIKSVSTDLITNQGTAIKEALSTSISTIQEVKSRDPSVILITDGEDESLDTESLISMAKNASVKINILGVGTKEGSPIKLPAGSFVKDNAGNIVISKMNSDSLQKIAAGSGGLFKTASYTDSDIIEILNVKTEINQGAKKNFTVYNEKAHYLLFAVLIISLILIFCGKEASVFIFLMLLPTLNTAQAQESANKPEEMAGTPDILNLNEAYHAYQNQNYTAAEKSFEYYYNKYPQDLNIAQSYASSLYKNKKYDKARDIFNLISQRSEYAKQKFEALYNSGNSSFALNDFKKAISEYTQALKIKPDDENAKNNLELAKTALENRTPTPTHTPTPTTTTTPSSSQSPEPQQSPSPENKEQQQEKSDEKSNQQEDSQKNEENKEQNPEQQTKDQEDKKQDSEKQPEDEQSENQNTEEQEPNQQNEQPTPQEKKEMTAEEMKESEAKAWLESLPESPLLLRRKTSKTVNRSRQQW